jgi:hypothetical protein
MQPLKGALYNLHPHSGTNPDHARGILVGVVAAIMQERVCSFELAIDWIGAYLPNIVMADAVPESWRNKLGEYCTLGYN